MTEPINIPVWPGLAPGETTASPGRVLDDHGGEVTRVTDVTGATLYIYGADPNRARPAVLVCPGGGYDILAADLEGSEIADWLVSLGYVAAVLHYRVPQNRDGAAQDGRQALTLLRARAAEFGIAPGGLGVLGFSAGGHLALSLAASGRERPDFALAVYPAFLLDDAGGVMPEVRPDAVMPPVFLAQSADDSHFCTPVYAEALAAAGISIESRVYASGGHGYGVRLPADVPAASWTTDAARWLAERGTDRG